MVRSKAAFQAEGEAASNVCDGAAERIRRQRRRRRKKAAAKKAAKKEAKAAAVTPRWEEG